MMKKATLFLICLLLPVTIWGQFKSELNHTFLQQIYKNAQPQSVISFLGLDAGRFHMQQSYSMSYTTFGNKGFTQGLYLNTLSYEFSMPLTLSVQLGMAHQPFNTGNQNPVLRNGPFVAGAALHYKPTDKTSIHFEFRQRPYNTLTPYYFGY